jgi:peroxiredoxin
MSKQRLVIGSHAPDLTLVDKDGQSVRFSEVWNKGPVFLNFLRHFG